MISNRLLLLAAITCAPAIFGQTGFNFTSFDPPGSIESHALMVNNGGFVAGYYLNSSTNLFVGYIRRKNGTYTSPIAIPGDNTYVIGINDSAAITGYYYPPAPEVETSFLLQGTTKQLVEYPGATQTQVNRLNDSGDLVGIYVANDPSTYPGFLYVKSTNTWTSFSAGAATFAEGVNKRDVVVGSYTTIPYSTYSGFVRVPSGTITTVNYPGATQTQLNEINNCGVVVGTWDDASNLFHGFYESKGTFTAFEYPGAMETALDGINDLGELAGSYIGTDNVRHAFIATPASSGGPTSCQ